jgi:hypothetical protein
MPDVQSAYEIMGMVQKKLLNREIQHTLDNYGTGQDDVFKKHLVRIFRL